MAHQPGKRKRRGFAHAGGLVSARIKRASSARGFSEVRLLTAWEEVVGPAIAAIATPAKVSFAKAGLGATLTLYAKGAHGPELEMQLPAIRDRVNACYGYNAVTRVRITQVEPTGFAEAQTPFAPKPSPTPEVKGYGLDKVKSAELRDALESLGGHVLSRS